ELGWHRPTLVRGNGRVARRAPAPRGTGEFRSPQPGWPSGADRIWWSHGTLVDPARGSPERTFPELGPRQDGGVRAGRPPASGGRRRRTGVVVAHRERRGGAHDDPA